MGLAVDLYRRQRHDWQLDWMWCEKRISPGSGRMQLSAAKVRKTVNHWFE